MCSSDLALAESKKCGLTDLKVSDMQAIEPGITTDVMSVLTLEASVASRSSFGGTAPDRVSEQVRFWQERLK